MASGGIIMIRQIKNYLKKYHEANLWLEHAYVREEKKQALETTTAASETVYPTSDSVVIQPQVVFSQYDVGHNEEETNRIQELYHELDDAPFLPTFAAI